MSRHVSYTAMAVLLTLCVIVGNLSASIGNWAAESTVRAMLFPAALVLIVVLFFNRRGLFLLIVLLRGPIDRSLAVTKVGGSSFGAVFNFLVIVLAMLAILHEPRKFFKSVFPIWAPFLLLMTFALLRAPDFGSAFRLFLAFLSYVSVFTAPFYLRKFDIDMRGCVKIVLLSTIIPTLYGFVDYANGGMGGEYGNRIRSTFDHANIFAFYVVLAISLTFYAIKSTLMALSRTMKAILTAYTLVLIVLLGMTGTRGAWAGCLTVFVVYGAALDRKFLVGILLAVLLSLLLPPIQDRLSDLFQPAHYVSSYSADDSSFTWRRDLWVSAITWMQPKYYLLGYGLNSFFYYSLQISPRLGSNFDAHSVYVQVFFETGLVGISACGWLVYRLFILLKSGFQHDRLGTVLMITVGVEYLVFCISDNMLDYLSLNWYFAFTMGTACSIRFAAMEKASANRTTASQLTPWAMDVPRETHGDDERGGASLGNSHQ